MQPRVPRVGVVLKRAPREPANWAGVGRSLKGSGEKGWAVRRRPALWSPYQLALYLPYQIESAQYRINLVVTDNKRLIM